MIEKNVLIRPGAAISESATIMYGSIIYAGVKVGENSIIEENVVIKSNTTIGNNVRIGSGCIIEGNCDIGDNTTLHADVHIPNSNGKGAKIGQNVVIRSKAVIYDDIIIEDDVNIGHGSVIRQGTVIRKGVSIGTLNQIEGQCEIGEYSRLHSNVHISITSTIGKYCFIAPGFVPTNTPYPLSPLDEKYVKGVTVEDYVKIGANVTTAPGVKIGKNCLIGVGSVLTRDIPANSFAIGNPCIVKRSIDQLSGPPEETIKPYKIME